jgi:hypothetical protein
LNTVSPLNIMISDPPTQAEVQAMLDKINEIIAAGTRMTMPSNASGRRTKSVRKTKRNGK